MRKALSITLMLVVALAAVASAKPAEQTGKLDKFMFKDMSKTTDAVKTSNPGVFGTAVTGTTWFGGTHWDTTDVRWEANENGVWTFGSGVGSSFSPVSYADPNKDPGLHTLMEGWVGIDNTASHLTYFRRMTTSAAWQGGISCVGTPAGLGGSASLWAGALPSEADALCWAAGQGYGNNWHICVGKIFQHNSLTSVSWSWSYTNATETNYDYGTAYVDTTGDGSQPDVLVASYTGTIAASSASFTLVQGTDMRSDVGPYKLKYCLNSDTGYSDEDGGINTTCGGMAVDDVSVVGGGNNTTDTFESTDDGWVLQPPPPGEGQEWSDIVPFNEPAVADPCGCNLSDSVLVFTDLFSGGHTYLQDNIAASPWIDLVQANLAGAPGKVIEYQGYFEMPLKNYIFGQVNVQWYPAVCQVTGQIYTSPFTSDGFVAYYGGVPICHDDVDPLLNEYSTVVDVGAQQMRIALGVVNYCQFYPCSGITNSTPWFDNVRLGIYGSPDAPYLATSTVDRPMDAFPASGLLRADNAGRLDCNAVKGFPSPERNSELGDTLIVQGGTGGAEVYVEFAVSPGPDINSGALTAWLGNGFIQHVGLHDGQDWYAARLDTAEVGGSKSPSGGLWMTAYHEDNPGGRPAASDVAIDSTTSEIDPLGYYSRLKNDIFPDNLFTPGTRVSIMYRARYIPGGTVWYVDPDTTGGAFYEMEVLPSSMASDSTFNCVLYVDHFDGRGAQQFIESGLSTFLTTGSNNFENVAWDRWDVRAPSSSQASFGRPGNTEYGATVTQAFGYKTIVWSSGNLNGANLVKEDAEVLTPWLTYLGVGGNNLYLTGDGVAQSINEEVSVEGTGPITLLRQLCGVDYSCGTVRDAGCGPVSDADTTACLNVDPVAGTPRAANNLGRTVSHLAQGNGCPSFRSFDLLSPASGATGSPQADEEYSNGTDAYQYASITNVSTTPAYQTVVDGLSVHYRRDTNESCLFASENYPDEAAVAERLHEVLHFFGYDAGTACSDPTAGVPVPPPITDSKFKTALANFAPNPLMSGAKGTLQFVMAHEGKASVDIFDVNGRLVRTVFDGIAQEGPNTVQWDATDGNSRPVASGVYFYRLRANGEDLAKKLVVVRNGN